MGVFGSNIEKGIALMKVCFAILQQVSAGGYHMSKLYLVFVFEGSTPVDPNGSWSK